ncbi:hypothetical protein [Vibrio sp. LaRot3]|uniref:hypothetical protein n=1 Tax=Vibrio sp. LaRot3 TaxID=2998829 RepID=UPI0022CDC8FC|nr:hypothetical protein [Vibrio sp. LaRot3]MDA0147464.1 hypothetical protein [Vibrio sp. LaRot3]
MYTTEGFCDWCKKPSLLKKHDYLDGKCHYACRECDDMATLDVRQFNIAEAKLIERQAQSMR